LIRIPLNEESGKGSGQIEEFLMHFNGEGIQHVALLCDDLKTAVDSLGGYSRGMEITPEQFATIEHCLPKQRGNVSLSNLQVVNAILYVAEHGCKWRGLPKRFGNWHTIYTRMNRWTKAGVLDRMFEELQRAQVVRIKIEAVSLDSTSIKVHPDGTGR
jgi:transposase